ncbi:hypothetical protein [Nonomuraea rhodomycinica]|nr:hypothetical protein [Nonomuraea rhodomycinica]
MEFNHADLFEALAATMGERRALISPDARPSSPRSRSAPCRST